MKNSVTLFAGQSICILLSVCALTSLMIPMAHATSSYRLRKTTMMNVIEISDEQDFAQQVQRAGIVVALVYLPTCSACQEVLPQYESLANTSASMPVTYVQADFNRIPDIDEQYHITSVPTFIVYKNGTMVQTVNSTDIMQLQNVIQQNQ